MKSKHEFCCALAYLENSKSAGSSVHVDLAFLRKDMPQLAAHLPYRVVVSGHPSLRQALELHSATFASSCSVADNLNCGITQLLEPSVTQPVIRTVSAAVQDVSTVMELCRRWFPTEYAKAPRKRNAHTALSDIQDSMQQLRHYRCLRRPLQRHGLQRQSGVHRCCCANLSSCYPMPQPPRVVAADAKFFALCRRSIFKPQPHQQRK